jgi:hypothetical protein
MAGQKEETLNRLSNYWLLELARDVSEDQVDSGTRRDDLIKIIRSSLSLEEIKQKMYEIGSGQIFGELSEEGGWTTGGLLSASLASIISGFVILLLLGLPIYDFKYGWLTNSSIPPATIGDSYASSYDLAVGSVTFQGASRQLVGQLSIVWLIVVISILVMVLGFHSLASSRYVPERGKKRLSAGRSGSLIAIMGLILILLTIVQVSELASVAQFAIGQMKYTGDLVFLTAPAMAVMEGVVFLSGLEMNAQAF